MSQPMEPIQVAARRAGLTPHVLRAWEKRYGVVEPERSAGGRRLYSEEQITRLRLLQAAVAAGRRIGDVVRLSQQELRALVEDDQRAAPRDTGTDIGPGPHLAAALKAARSLDGAALRTTLGRATLLLTTWSYLEELIVPLLHEIGRQWAAGTLSPGQERLASGVVREELGMLLRRFEAPAGAPGLVVATPASQRHELGALVAAVYAALRGWRVTYLGADLPAADIARAVTDTGARMVALSITTADGEKLVGQELRALRAALPPGINILVGGQGSDAHGAVLDAIGAVRLDQPGTLPQQVPSMPATL